MNRPGFPADLVWAATRGSRVRCSVNLTDGVLGAGVAVVDELARHRRVALAAPCHSAIRTGVMTRSVALDATR
jgi:hypothetical protein